MNVIIIAAISLLVLVIISFLVIPAGGDVSQGTGCSGAGGTCVDKTTDNARNCNEWSENTGTQYIASQASCPNDGEFCCVPLGN